ncbi:hypothetical protein [Antarctobacter sp.]|uniref:hypothetical protein n=1 Tax=Antarctobacter sp. TaxID=1872577 RepID=UPI003A92FDE7
MSFAKTIRLLALAGFGVFLADYASQWARTGAGFGAPHYVQTLMARVTDTAGRVGLVPRGRSDVAAAMPPAPAGWTAEPRRAAHKDFLYSREQSLAFDRDRLRATGPLPHPSGGDRTDKALGAAFPANTSMVYINDHGMIGLEVDDPASRIVQPARPPVAEAVKRPADLADPRNKHATYQGVRWVELRDPIVMADNGHRPHRLRVFVARLGAFDLKVTARAPDHHIERFFQTVDLRGIRGLSAPPEGEMPRALPAKMALALPKAGPVTPVSVWVNRALD